MAGADLDFVEGFFRALSDAPLGPDDPRYVASPDPAGGGEVIARLAGRIRRSGPESLQLLTGPRGVGKTTQLRVLRARLEADGAVVAAVDLEDYLDLAAPVGVPDVLLAVVGGFDEVLSPGLAGGAFWDRVRRSLLEAGMDLPGAAASSLKDELKLDPGFGEWLREVPAGRAAALVARTHHFVEERVRALWKQHGGEVRVVLLVDSLEHVRGVGRRAGEVAASLAGLLVRHARELRLPYVHVVFTAPFSVFVHELDALEAQYDGLERLFFVPVRDAGGRPWEPGLAWLEDVVGRRGDWRRLLGDRARFEPLALASGGSLRELFRLLKACLIRAEEGALPVGRDGVVRAIAEVGQELVRLPRRELARLARASDAGELRPARDGEGRRLLQYLEDRVVLAYRDDSERYAIHPLIADHLRRSGHGERA